MATLLSPSHLCRMPNHRLRPNHNLTGTLQHFWPHRHKLLHEKCDRERHCLGDDASARRAGIPLWSRLLQLDLPRGHGVEFLLKILTLFATLSGTSGITGIEELIAGTEELLPELVTEFLRHTRKITPTLNRKKMPTSQLEFF